jgi:hypothetical protein
MSPMKAKRLTITPPNMKRQRRFIAPKPTAMPAELA